MKYEVLKAANPRGADLPRGLSALYRRSASRHRD
nr:MAG TPA: hypothetical protein [Caudoviricetes sp.]